MQCIAPQKAGFYWRSTAGTPCCTATHWFTACGRVLLVAHASPTAGSLPFVADSSSSHSPPTPQPSVQCSPSPRLASSASNLLRNPNFASGTTAWRASSPSCAILPSISTSLGTPQDQHAPSLPPPLPPPLPLSPGSQQLQLRGLTFASVTAKVSAGRLCGMSQVNSAPRVCCVNHLVVNSAPRVVA